MHTSSAKSRLSFRNDQIIQTEISQFWMLVKLRSRGCRCCLTTASKATQCECCKNRRWTIFRIQRIEIKVIEIIRW